MRLSLFDWRCPPLTRIAFPVALLLLSSALPVVCEAAEDGAEKPRGQITLKAWGVPTGMQVGVQGETKQMIFKAFKEKHPEIKLEPATGLEIPRPHHGCAAADADCWRRLPRRHIRELPPVRHLHPKQVPISYRQIRGEARRRHHREQPSASNRRICGAAQQRRQFHGPVRGASPRSVLGGDAAPLPLRAELSIPQIMGGQAGGLPPAHMVVPAGTGRDGTFLPPRHLRRKQPAGPRPRYLRGDARMGPQNPRPAGAHLRRQHPARRTWLVHHEHPILLWRKDRRSRRQGRMALCVRQRRGGRSLPFRRPPVPRAFQERARGVRWRRAPYR